ncbi:hypothetical protein EC968_007864 [Mortierella alpina]|nr:hypothetical protein EC968_007864 [Mortierella alpina]
MPKHKAGTPPGTGYVGCLTAEQKQCLKDVWAAVLTFLVSNESTLGSRKSGKRYKKVRVSGPNETSNLTFCTDRVAELAPENKGDYGLYGVALREALWSHALGDHPERGLDMLMRGLRWRVSFDVGELATKNEDELDKKYSAFKHQFKTGKVFVYGRDKMGRVVV